MKYAISGRTMWWVRTGTVGVSLLLLSSCAEPVHVAWNDSQPVVEPKTPPPQGLLTVYSERYVVYDGDVPRNYRQPVDVYSVDGQVVAREHNSTDEAPIQFDLTPGRYIVASESHMQLRQVEVDVKDGRQTVVPESMFEHAPLLASTRPQQNQQPATPTTVAHVSK